MSVSKNKKDTKSISTVATLHFTTLLIALIKRKNCVTQTNISECTQIMNKNNCNETKTAKCVLKSSVANRRQKLQIGAPSSSYLHNP